jgi:hypothetical protein
MKCQETAILRGGGASRHLSELDNDGGGGWGGRSRGHREAESGKGSAGEVGDARKQSRGRGPPATVEGMARAP